MKIKECIHGQVKVKIAQDREEERREEERREEERREEKRSERRRKEKGREEIRWDGKKIRGKENR